MSGLSRACPPLLAGLVALGAAIRAQDQPRPVFRTDANYVRVDVYPTRDGKPVDDLREGELEVLEDGVRQRIEAFERVAIAGGSHELQREPNTVAESRTMLENPRARVFVVFLDVPHVGVEGAARIREPLTDALDRLIGPEDLVAVMTPSMAADDLAFARKSASIARLLERHPFWGDRGRMVSVDPVDEEFRRCYPAESGSPTGSAARGVADTMIARRHEKRTLDALQDVVRYLHGFREERKAILVVTEGWVLFRPDSNLARAHGERVPGQTPLMIDPRTGRPTITAPPDRTLVASCDRDRLFLASLDNDEQFREMLDEANRANASYYPIDPRGLATFDDNPVGGPAPTTASPAVDRARLQARARSMRDLAALTDGVALLGTNDIAAGMRRIVDDLSSYYLVGYSSSGRLDGRFHAISVRTTRPGVSVRTRRGYLAPSAADIARLAARGAAGSDPGAAAAAAEALAIDGALAPLNSYARERTLRVHGVAGWSPGHLPVVWAVGELGASWKGRAEVDLTLTIGADRMVATSHVELAPGTRSFRAALAPVAALEPGDYFIRARARSGADAMVASDTLGLSLRAEPAATSAVFVRRGAVTGNRDVATSDLRYRRTEQLRVEVPFPGLAAPSGRLLDRTGRALTVPVATSVRDDPDGSRWHTAQVSLAPLRAGDYVVELVWPGPNGPGTSGVAARPAADTRRTLLAFRVVP